MNFFKKILGIDSKTKELKKQLTNMLGFVPRNILLYKTALSHRSIKETVGENNERLEFLGDAILGSIVAHYLFMKYPYKGEGFLTEMRSKMVNRNKLNEIALKIGIKKIALYNKFDYTLRASQIFGNTLEALIGAVYMDKGYDFTKNWIQKIIIQQHFFIDDLEDIDINIKNKLYGWANKNAKTLTFETISEKIEGKRKVFTVAAMLDGENIAETTAYNKKEGSQIAAQIAIEKLGL